MTREKLILGYGNVDRQDDGVAWHILTLIAKGEGLPVSEILDEKDVLEGLAVSKNSHSPNKLDIVFVTQLLPEMAEMLAAYESVCFVDAHTGSVPQDIHFVELTEGYQPSPMTHHLTPQTCLALAATLYGHAPHGFLLSVLGYEFGFSNVLSEKTKRLSVEAVEQLAGWLRR